ncbi:AbrB/MazE/SpoVT family DNA-binding domain-containing protein [Candidatus Micrarchaeota archaeon]|nr:AbrB/MazE/SpoVT family DNA-binding domain-containing protein [Candidatus Micrarchaeota archaeon]
MKLEDDKIKCVSCGGWAKPAKIRIDGLQIRGWQCECGEQILNSDDAEWLLLMNKTKKKAFTAKVSKVGNSYSVRLPKEIVDVLGLKEQLLRIEVGLHEIRLVA